MQIKDVMSHDVMLANPGTSIQEASALMRDGSFGMLPVGENDRLVGVLTDRDIAVRCCASGRDPKVTTVGEVMSNEVRWAFQDSSVKDAANLMQKHQVRRLPVINSDMRLVGILALGDFAVESSEIRPAAETLSKVSRAA